MNETMRTRFTPSKDALLSTKEIHKLLHVPYTRLYAWWRRGAGPDRTGVPQEDFTKWFSTLQAVDDWLAKHWLGEPEERQQVCELHPRRSLLSISELAYANKMPAVTFKKLIKMIRNPLVYLVCNTYLFDPRDAMSWASVVAQLRISLGYNIEQPWEDITL